MRQVRRVDVHKVRVELVRIFFMNTAHVVFENVYVYAGWERVLQEGKRRRPVYQVRC